jgi:hypothetical protein
MATTWLPEALEVHSGDDADGLRDPLIVGVVGVGFGDAVIGQVAD